MRDYLKFYIGGEWVDPASPQTLDVTDPATEAVCGRISIGSAADVDRAVAAAQKAFPAWSVTTREERLAVLENIVAEFQDFIHGFGARPQRAAGQHRRGSDPFGIHHRGDALPGCQELDLLPLPQIAETLRKAFLQQRRRRCQQGQSAHGLPTACGNADPRRGSLGAAQ